MIDCTISENLATAPSASGSTGGGVCNYNFNDQTSGDKNVIEGGTITLTNCTISKDHVFGKSGCGGGIENGNLVALGKIALMNCAIFGNTAAGYGGGIYNSSAVGRRTQGTLILTNCTVCDNAASRGGSGIYDSYFLHVGIAITLTNCIFFGDKGDEIANDYTQTADDYKLLHALGGKIKRKTIPPMKISVTLRISRRRQHQCRPALCRRFGRQLSSEAWFPVPQYRNPDGGVWWDLTTVHFSSALSATASSQAFQISMDGKCCALDNVFTERLWRTVKYEEMYLHYYEDSRAACKGLSGYFEFYNQKRLHQALNYRTPAEVHFDPILQKKEPER